MSSGDRKRGKAMDGAGRGAAEVESLVDSFRGVTSATREEALFFLESHEWQLDPAIESFYEDQPPEGDEDEEEEDEESDKREEDEAEEREGEEADSDDEDYVPSENEEAGNAAVTRRRSAITTFSDLKRKGESDSDHDTDSDEDQDYYTGGQKR